MANPPDLHELLDRLEAAVDDLDADDVESRERVNALATRLRQRMDAEDDAQMRGEVMEELEGQLTEFEVSHPRLTLALQKIINTLSNVGI